MNVLSLFDGMSCTQIALDRLGITPEHYYASEIDKYAIAVTQANYPNTVQLGDVRNIRWRNDPLIDLLVCGSPCQGFSFAGKGKAFKDERSKLFYEAVRIIEEAEPTYFLIENVRMKQEYQDVISDLLGVTPIKICSSLLSAQRRVRYYWTNIPGICQPEDKGIVLNDIIEDGVVDRDKAHCIDANYYKGGNLKSYFEKHRRQLVFTNETYTNYRKLTPNEVESLQTVPKDYTKHVSNTQRFKMLGNGFTVDIVSHILSHMKGI